MKKKSFLLIVAVISLIFSYIVFAESTPKTTLYGQFRYSVNMINEDGTGAKIDGIQGSDNVSRLGVKGSVDNGNIRIFYHLETQAFADKNRDGFAFKQRFYYGGLKGRFGQIVFGRMTNAYKKAGLLIDPFYNMAHINSTGAYSATGASYGLSTASNGFTDNSLQYETNSLHGIKLTGGVYLDDSNENEHGYALGVSYQTNGFTIGSISAFNGESVTTFPGIDQNGNATRIYSTYKFSAHQIGISYENIDTQGENVNFFFMTSTVSIQSMHTDLSFSAGVVDAGPAQGFGFTACGFYSIVENARFFCLFSFVDLEEGSGPHAISVGALYGFSLF